MSREGIAEWAIIAVITSPEWSQIGETAGEYRSRVAGLPLPLPDSHYHYMLYWWPVETLPS